MNRILSLAFYCIVLTAFVRRYCECTTTHGVCNIKIITIYDVSNSYFVAVVSCGCPETRDKQFVFVSQYTQTSTGHLCEA